MGERQQTTPSSRFTRITVLPEIDPKLHPKMNQKTGSA
jgi:hypothetical protein